MVEIKDNSTKSFPLLSLPDVAIENILDYLNVNTLKNLRLVSKASKALVEQSRYLKKIKLNISSFETCMELLEFPSNVKWSNYCFSNNYYEDKPTPELSFSRLGSFINTYGPHIHSLEVFKKYWNWSFNHKSMLNYVELNLILSTINPNVEKLRFGSIELSSSFDENMSNAWIKNLMSLKTLHIYYVKNIETNSLFVYKILQSCPNLEFLTTPVSASFMEIEKQDKWIHRFIITPLLKYFKENSTVRRNLIIKITENDRMFRSPSEYSVQMLEDLHELVKICSDIGVRFDDFNCNGLPRYGGLKETNEKFNNVVKDVIGYNTDFQNFYIPPRSRVYLRLNYNDSNYNTFQLIPQIHSLNSFCNTNGTNVNTVLDCMVNNLVQVSSSLEELKFFVPGNENRDYAFRFCNTIISNHFPNLKKLICMIGLRGDNNLYTSLFRYLPMLEHLDLLECQNLTDDEIVGPDIKNPLIHQLKRLTCLKLLNADRLTDASFVNAISRMGLKIFKYILEDYDERVRVPLYTFKVGISSLAEGIFANSIENFNIAKPRDCQKSDIMKFGYRFKNIRKVCVRRE